MNSQERLKVLNKIACYEKQKLWNKDVESDPDTIILKANKVDYLNKKLVNKCLCKFSNTLAVSYFEKLIKQNKFIIKEVKGLENYRKVEGGAILTCNHFNAFDNYAVYKAIKQDLGKKRLYKVIREGNYTNFPGFYGLLFKHCNTLPLSSSFETMKLFMNAVSTLLKRGEKVLVYPEQAMWWNYRKPRPLQNGAFKIAVKNNVPVVPFFITMEDSEFLDEDGFNIQQYTIHILPAIYPDEKITSKENVENMKNVNYEKWKSVYEEFYGIPLEYLQSDASGV